MYGLRSVFSSYVVELFNNSSFIQNLLKRVLSLDQASVTMVKDQEIDGTEVLSVIAPRLMARRPGKELKQTLRLNMLWFKHQQEFIDNT